MLCWGIGMSWGGRDEAARKNAMQELGPRRSQSRSSSRNPRVL